MNLEQELAQAKSDLADSKTALEASQKEATDAKSRVTSLESENATLKAENGVLTGDRTRLQGEATKLQGDLAARDQKIKDLEAKDTDVDRRAGAKSAATLRKLGIKPIAETTEANPSTNAGDLWAQCNAIQDPKEKRKFYLEHKEQMP